MPSEMQALRRLFPHRFSRQPYSFELLRSSSASAYEQIPSSGDSPQLPRHFSFYDHPVPPRDDSLLLKRKDFEKSEEIVDCVECSAEMSNSSLLLGFVSSVESELTAQSASYRFLTTDSDYERAIGECQIIKQSAFFSQGVLLKCIDHKPIFPYLHLAQFRWRDQAKRVAEIGEKIREISPDSRSFYGSYDEISCIQKTAVLGETNLPTNRHAGYIVISFKILDDANKQQNLEKTWLAWSGAREIYKHSPRNWNLRKISLLKHPFIYKNGSNRPFAYILLCEYSSILHPANTIQALDICERLRTRNCGLVSLYQVHTSYLSEAPSAPSSSMLSSGRRYPMSRGFSEDVVEVKRESPRRAPRLRSRERSLQIPDEHFYPSYQMP